MLKSLPACFAFQAQHQQANITNLQRQLQQPELLVAARARCGNIQPWLGKVHLAQGGIGFESACSRDHGTDHGSC